MAISPRDTDTRFNWTSLPVDKAQPAYPNAVPDADSEIRSTFVRSTMGGDQVRDAGDGDREKRAAEDVIRHRPR
jgi:hypothetical protein